MVFEMVMEEPMKFLSAVASLLAGVGATNWLVIEVFSVDLVQVVSMGSAGVASLIYVLAGLAGLGILSRAVSRLAEFY